MNKRIFSIIVACLSLIPFMYLTSVSSSGEVEREYPHDNILIGYVDFSDKLYLSSAQNIAALESFSGLEELNQYLKQSMQNFDSQLNVLNYYIYISDLSYKQIFR